MKKPSPLGLVGLYFILRAEPGFHGQVVAEAPGPWVTVDVCSWGDHKPAAVRMFSAEDLRACDLYRTKAAWLAAVAEVVKTNAKKTAA